MGWRVDTKVSLHNKSLYKVTMGKEVEPLIVIENSKYFNKLHEDFGLMCVHISREFLFHLDRLKTPREVWKSI